MRAALEPPLKDSSKSLNAGLALQSIRAQSDAKNFMSDAKAFFDTNVLLYMDSDADLGKQARAQELFHACADSGRLVLSTQVIQEFFVAGLRKLKLPRQQLRQATGALLELPLILIGPTQILKAVQNEEYYQISFWDALILAAAESGGAEVLYSEDLNDRQKYGTVLVRNPFRASETHLPKN